MPVLAYPGPGAPRPPRVAVEVPPSWVPVPAGGDLLRARGAGESGAPVQVAVRQHLSGPGLEVGTLVAELAVAPADVASAEIEDPFVVDIAGREWQARHVSWDEVGGPVIEVHLATAVGPADDPSVAQFVHVVGRVRGAGLGADYDILQAVLDTLVVEGDRANEGAPWGGAGVDNIGGANADVSADPGTVADRVRSG